MLVVMVERGATFGYFIPTMLRLQQDSALGEIAVRAAFARWARLNHLRSLLTLLAWFATLRVISMP